jgi:LacI family transcriptional regulator
MTTSSEPVQTQVSGYREAIRARGLGDEIAVASTTYPQEGGYLGTQQLLARFPQPTAIFASADIVAMGVFQALPRPASPSPATSR